VSTEFALNTFAFGDTAGAGEWLVGHYRQHLRYNGVLRGRTPPIVIPEFAILTIEGGDRGRKFWLDAHSNWHQLLRPFANITGIDLAVVDLNDQAQFYSWIDAHNQEHALLDRVFGVA
jgi:hypothetical protein